MLQIPSNKNKTFKVYVHVINFKYIKLGKNNIAIYIAVIISIGNDIRLSKLIVVILKVIKANLQIKAVHPAGRIRNTPEPNEDTTDGDEDGALSLGLFPGERPALDDRAVFR